MAANRLAHTWDTHFNSAFVTVYISESEFSDLVMIKTKCRNLFDAR